MALLEEFRKARIDGIKTPQVAFIMNFQATENTREMLRSIYQDLYRPGLYRDLWFCLLYTSSGAGDSQILPGAGADAVGPRRGIRQNPRL